MSPITKAVFPVAGLGSRFLPATKASPKEMMPIVDKPLIQYAVEEAIAAGITELIFVTGRNKRAIEDHFDKACELENVLTARGKAGLLDTIRRIMPKQVNCIFVRQPEPLGLGHAILCAKPVIGREPFAVVLADDLIDARPCVLAQMIAEYRQHCCSIIGVQNVERNETDQYGIVSCGAHVGTAFHVTDIVEKPHPADAPSTLAVVGRYILTPDIFDHLEMVTQGAGSEIQLTDAIATLLLEEHVLACKFDGVRYDCGSKLGYLKATLAYGLAHPEVGAEFALHLEKLTRARVRSRDRNPSAAAA